MASTATGPGGSRPDPTVRTRVLDAFVALVADRGLVATSIDDVATAAGGSKTTLYTRWSDRTALVADGFRYVAAAIPEEPDDDRDPAVMFEEHLSAMLDVAADPEAQVIRRQVLAELIAVGGIDDEIRPVRDETYAQWEHAARNMVELGKRAGAIPAERDTGVAVEVVMAIVAVRHLFSLPLGPPLRDLVTRLLTEDRPY